MRDFRRQITSVPLAAWIVIGGLFLVGLGNVVPILAVFMRKSLGLTLLDVSTLMTVRLWTQRGGSLFGGMLADRFGPRRLMVIGLLIRALANVVMIFAHGFGGVFVSVALLGAGAALYSPASKKALMSVSRSDNKVFLLSLRNTTNNLGVALGPTLCLALAERSFRMVFVSAAGLFFLCALVTRIGVPASPRASVVRRLDWRAIFASFSERRVVLLFAVMALFFAFYAQLDFTVTLFATETYSRAAVGLLFTANALTVLLLQMALASWIERSAVQVAVPIGLAAAGLGFLVFASKAGLPIFLSGVAIFTISEIIIEPKIDGEVARLFPAEAMGTGFGVMSLACSLGGAIGNYAGGGAMTAVRAGMSHQMMWILFGAAALLGAAAAMVALERSFRDRSAGERAGPLAAVATSSSESTGS